MKWIRSALLLTFLAAFAGGQPVWADRGHHHHHHRHDSHGRAQVGVFVGAPLFWYPRSYYYPYYQRVVVVPSSPPLYIEQQAPSSKQYWYFCSEPQGYYPYVKQCRTGWQQVTPQPTASNLD
jgi:hypothetical protein